MSWITPLRARSRRPSGSARAGTLAPRRRRPRLRNLEVLEGRTLLSTILVDTVEDELLDNGKTSLREAVAFSESTPGATIEFAPSLAGGTLILRGEITIDRDVRIVGLGRDQLTITVQQGYEEIPWQNRLFSVLHATVNLSGVTLTGGWHVLGGGAIHNEGGVLTIRDSTLIGNRAGPEYVRSQEFNPYPFSRGGAIWNEGGALTLVNCDLHSNSAVGSPHESIDYYGNYFELEGSEARGGAIYSAAGSVVLQDCRFDGNTAYGGVGHGYYEATADGGDAWGGAVYSTGGPVTVSESSFFGNRAIGGAGSTTLGAYIQTPGGDGGDARGGALYVEGGRLELLDSLLHENSARGGSGGDGRGVRDVQHEFTHSSGDGGRGGSAEGGGVFGGVILSGSSLTNNSARGGNGGAGTSIDVEFFYRAVPGGSGGAGGSAWGGGISGQVYARQSLVEANQVAGGLGGALGQGYDPDWDEYGSGPDGSPGPDGSAAYPNVHGSMQPILEVAGEAINDGALQRSNIETLTLTFNQPAGIESLITSGAITGAVQVVDQATGTPLVLGASRYRYDAASFTLTIDLTLDGFGGSGKTMLADGRYQLRIDTNAVTAQGDPDNRLRDDDSLRDAVLRRDFHRLEGDFDGDAVVSLADRPFLTTRFGTRVGRPTFALYCDLNGDGVISLADYLIWTRKLGRRV